MHILNVQANIKKQLYFFVLKKFSFLYTAIGAGTMHNVPGR